MSSSPELLDRGVVDEVPLLRRRRVPRRGLKGLPERLGRCVVREGLAQPAGQVLAPRFLLREAKGMGEHHLKLTDPERETILCKDPFQSRDERIERLIGSI